MNERCPVCGLIYEREEGYFSSSMAINIVISEFILAGIALPLAWNPHIQIFQALPIGISVAIILPLLFYRHSRSLWLSMDHWLHPLNSDPT